MKSNLFRSLMTLGLVWAIALSAGLLLASADVARADDDPPQIVDLAFRDGSRPYLCDQCPPSVKVSLGGNTYQCQYVGCTGFACVYFC